jgi:hypothetical protein
MDLFITYVIAGRVSQSSRAPNLADAEVAPKFVRDEPLTCFERANKEFARILGQPVTDEQLKQQAREFVQGTLSQCGVSYVNPTKQGIMLAISECKANAERMIGHQGAKVIQHHYEEVMKLVSRLRE